MFLPHREPRPAAWSVYAATVDPLSPLFTPAGSVSHIVVHEGYNRRTHTSDITLMRLAKALDLTAAPVPRKRRPGVPPKRWSQHH